MSDPAPSRPARTRGDVVPFDVLRFAALPEDRRGMLLHVNGLLDQIAHGSLVLVLQDRKVIQVETSEKIRLR